MNLTLIQAAGGNRAAKEALAARLRPRLARMAHYYGRRCGEDPDDLLQEAWLGVLEALPRVDVTIGCPEQHLLRRAKWRLLDAIKRARVRRCLPLEDAALDAEPEFDSAPESACVEQFLAGLTVSHRRLVECLLDGMTWREAGAELGCTSANVAYHMRKIRSQFDAWNSDGPLASPTLSRERVVRPNAAGKEDSLAYSRERLEGRAPVAIAAENSPQVDRRSSERRSADPTEVAR